MNDLFNSPFEAGLRTLLVLSTSDSRGLTIDRIVSYDFMTLYGSDFGISDSNLHGTNQFSFSELSSKRTIISAGLKTLILDGLISMIQNEKGFVYSLTPIGTQYVEKLESTYKTQYLYNLNIVQERYDSVSDIELINIINNTAVKTIEVDL